MSSSSSRHLAIGIAKKDAELTSLNLETPHPGVEEVFIKVFYIGMTPLSQWQVDFGLLVHAFPHVLGGAIVGKVIETGSDVKHVQKGEMVMGFSWERTAQKASQEFVVVPSHLCSKIPNNLSLPEAASVPDSFVTAWHSLMTELDIPLLSMVPNLPGNLTSKEPGLDLNTSFLIWGGATSSGMFAIQLLKLSGFKNIITTASPKNADLLRLYGAHHVVDYREEDVTDKIRALTLSGKVDVVLDCVGDEEKTIRPISRVVGEGSRVGILLPIRVGGYGSTTSVAMETKVVFPEGVKVVGVRTHYYTANPVLKDALQPQIMNALLASAAVKPNPIRLISGATFLERAQNALDVMRRGAVSGEKLVVRVAGDEE